MQSEWISLCLALAQNGNVSDTAEQFEMSRQVLSRKIGALENELNTALFFKLGTQWQLTPAGASFIQAAPELLQTLYQIENLNQRLHKEVVSVGWGGSWGIQVLPYLTRAIFSSLDLNIMSHSIAFKDALELLDLNELDIYLGTYAIDQVPACHFPSDMARTGALWLGEPSPFVIVGKPRNPVIWSALHYIHINNISFKTSVWDEQAYPRSIKMYSALAIDDALAICLNSDLALYLPEIFVRPLLVRKQLSILCEPPENHTMTPFFMLNKNTLADKIPDFQHILRQHGFNTL